jgi:hypothetical protein
MSAEKRREIASLGGKSAHRKGTAHEFTPDEARDAGRKGGLKVSRNSEHMAAIGRLGGGKSKRGKAAEPADAAPVIDLMDALKTSLASSQAAD